MLRELFAKVLSEYKGQRTSNAFAKNPMGDLLRHALPDELRNSSHISESYEIRGSSGAGRWAIVPWLAVLDLEITDTPEHGFYIVYLFDAEMQGVYLSLNQGWTQYEEKFKSQPIAREEISKATKFLQHQLKSTLTDFTFGEIHLNDKHNLAQGYERGHICGKYYAKDAIPSDVDLVNDLWKIVGVYRELKGIVGHSILDLSITDLEPETIDLINAHYSSDISISELVLEPITAEAKRKFSSREMIFDEEKELEKAKRNKKIGDNAEAIVFEAEKDRLRKANKTNLANNVKIVSRNMSLGYDILSFEEDGTEKYIEVKGSQTYLTSFFLSANELEKSKDLKNYYLYIVHGLSKQSPIVQYVRRPNFDSNEFLLQSRSFLVKYKPHLSI